jgi:hypothetical protein
VVGKAAGYPLFSGCKIRIVMVRPLDEIVPLDRCWFRAHPTRKHRCGWPDKASLLMATPTVVRVWSSQLATSDVVPSLQREQT